MWQLCEGLNSQNIMANFHVYITARMTISRIVFLHFLNLLKVI